MLWDVHETAEDIRALQALIDDSHAAAGAHLRSIFTDERRIPAEELCDLLHGVQVLNVATVTAAGEPRVAPVDGLFFRGRFYFGSSPESARFQHLRARPYVSASHTRGEELAVIVHGTASILDLGAEENTSFRAYLMEVYGLEWETWGADASYARIDSGRMYTFRFSEA